MSGKLDPERIELLMKKMRSYPFFGFIFGLALFLISVKVFDVAYIFFTLSILILILRIKDYLIENKVAKISSVLEDLTIDINIERNELGEDIARNIGEEDKIFHIIVGSSGSGKSRIIEEHVPKFYNNNLPKESFQIILNTYSRIEDSLLEKINEKNNSTYQHILEALAKISEEYSVILVFDQLESLFLLEENNAKHQLRILCNLFMQFEIMCEKREECEEIEEFTIKCILIIRKDWYFNLKFFQDYIPHIKKVHVIDGFDPIVEPRAWNSIEDKIRVYLEENRINNNKLPSLIFKNCYKKITPQSYYVVSCKNFEELKKRNEEGLVNLLPVELVTVIKSMAVRCKIDNKDINEKTFTETSGMREAIGMYFEYYLTAFGDKADAAKVLYALSVEPKSSRSLRVEEISKLTSLNTKKVEKVLEFFSEKNLLDEVLGNWDWKHDFFAERFNEISGKVLDPTDRDNINYFWAQKDNLDKIKIKPQKNFYQWFGFSLFFTSVFLLLVRFFSPIITKLISPVMNIERWVQPLFTIKHLQSLYFDLSFLPITVSLILWSWYVTTLFRRILSQLNESFLGIVISYFVAFWSLICVVLSIRYPQYWLSLIGIGGFAVGLKYKQITKEIESHFVIHRLWKETIFNSLITIFIVGVTYKALFPPNSVLLKPNGITLGIITFVVTIVIVYWARLCIINHIGLDRCPRLLGLYNRKYLKN